MFSVYIFRAKGICLSPVLSRILWRLSARLGVNPRKVALDRRLDILVQPEEVRRVVLVLQGDQPVILLTVHCPDPVLFVYIKVVDIGSLAFIWSHRLPELTCPANVLVVLRWVGPRAHDDQAVGSAALTECRLIFADAAHGAT